MRSFPVDNPRVPYEVTAEDQGKRTSKARSALVIWPSPALHPQSCCWFFCAHYLLRSCLSRFMRGSRRAIYRQTSLRCGNDMRGDKHQCPLLLVENVYGTGIKSIRAVRGRYPHTV